MIYPTKKIKDIGTVVTGKTPLTARADYYGGQYMFVTPTELHGSYKVTTSEKTITEAGLNSIKSNSISGESILVGCIGWDMGNVAMCFEKCATNQQINSITKIKKECIPAYLYYWLRTKKDYLFSIASVTRTPILSKGVFEDIDVPLPDVETQRNIANVLQKLDKKIELNERINDNLWQTISTIYDYWFTQFDFPDVNGKPYYTAGGEMVWNDKIKRAIPSGWTVASIINNPLTQVIKPGVDAFTTKEYLATADVIGTSIASGSIIDYENREGRANMQPTINSVWFAKMKNSIKHLFLNKEMAPIIDSAILSTGFCGLKCAEKSFEYVSSFISNPRFEIVKDILAHGATQEAVNNDDMESIAFIIPSDEILEQYHAVTKDMFAQISQNICENRELIKVRDWLLPMLMNGQATIAD